MELKTNKDFLPAGADGAAMDQHIAAALAGADPDSYSALEDAIKSVYAWDSSESRDTTGRLNAMRLMNSIAAVTGGYGAEHGEGSAQPEEGDVIQPEVGGDEEPQTSDEPADQSDAAPVDANAEKKQFTTNSIEEYFQQQEDEGGNIPNKDDSGGIEQIAAVGKAQGPAAKSGQATKSPASRTDDNEKVKVNELGTGAEAQRSQQNGPRMSDVLHGGKPEGAVMNAEKKNRPQPASQASEPPSGPPPMKFDPQTEKYLSELHPNVAALAREHLTRIVQANTGYQVKITKAYRSYEEQEDEYAKGRFGNPGATVTKSGAGESTHNFRAGYDIAFIDTKKQKMIEDPNDPAYQTAGRIGEALGLTWGFRFPAVDGVHFELSDSRGVDINTMRQRYESGKDIYTGK
jgi:D-alanyl-D-alanine carboxypeptidase